MWNLFWWFPKNIFAKSLPTNFAVLFIHCCGSAGLGVTSDLLDHLRVLLHDVQEAVVSRHGCGPLFRGPRQLLEKVSDDVVQTGTAARAHHCVWKGERAQAHTQQKNLRQLRVLKPPATICEGLSFSSYRVQSTLLILKTGCTWRRAAPGWRWSSCGPVSAPPGASRTTGWVWDNPAWKSTEWIKTDCGRRNSAAQWWWWSAHKP